MASLLLPGCLPFEFLERAQEGQQGLALLGGQVDHLLPCRRRLAAVPEHRLEQTPSAPVVKNAGVAVDRPGEADPPERRRGPLPSCRASTGPIVGGTLPNCVYKQGSEKGHESGRRKVDLDVLT